MNALETAAATWERIIAALGVAASAPADMEPIGAEPFDWRRFREATAKLQIEASSAIGPDFERALDLFEAVLMFHSGGQWDETKEARWRQLVGCNEATTRALCDAVRNFLRVEHVRASKHRRRPCEACGL